MNRSFQSMIAKFTQARTSRSSRRERASRRTRLEVEALASRLMPTHVPIAIQFNFDLDASNWFSDPTPVIVNGQSMPQGQQRRDVLQEAADDLTGRLGDHLTAIPLPPAGSSWTVTLDHPGTNNPTPEQNNERTLQNLTVPENTLIIFVGSRDLEDPLDGKASTGEFNVSLSWNNETEEEAARAWDATVRGRGQPGALLPDAEQDDVAPWGGTVAFDPNTTWNYTPRTGNFYNVAQHEIGHLLGFFPGPSAFANKVMNNEFTGDAAKKANGGKGVPVVIDGQGAHLDNKATSDDRWPYDSPNDDTSDDRQVTMAGTGNGTARGFTTLDYAVLDDIGWDILPPPGPGPEGSFVVGGPRQVVVAIEGLTNKSPTPPAGFQGRPVNRVVLNNRLYQAVTQDDESFFIEVSDDNGATFRDRKSPGESARGNPSLAVNDGKLFICWTGTEGGILDKFGHINVAEVTVGPKGEPTGLTNKDTLGYTSEHAPSIESISNSLVLAFAGEDDHLYLDVKATAGPKTQWGQVRDTGEFTESPPGLTAFNNGVILSWIGTDDAPNFAQVVLAVQNHTPLQAMTVSNGVLTIDGDQRALNFDDSITIERAPSGGARATLNDQVAEFAEGSLTGIVVNTRGGSNTVRVLSTFPGVPLTITGAGLDRLTFGTGLPTPVYSPDTNGLPGYGTLEVSGMAIHFKGLEFVHGVTPDVTGVQLDSVTIDEHGVATVTGTFTDPGSYSTHSLAISWGDGTSDTPARLVLGKRSFTATHRYIDDNPTGTPSDTYAITATVTDNDNLADSGTTSVTLNNVGPRLANVTVTPEIDENGVVTLSGDILDPGTLDTFTLVVNWGEGAPQSFSYPAGTTHFSQTHQYLDDNPTGTPQDMYAIGLTLTDDDTGQATAAGTTLVKNVAPVFTALCTSSTSAGPAREGEPVTICGTFADVGTLDTHAVTVDWGDGTVAPAALTEAGGSGSFSAQHAYQFGGIYPVLITLRDDDTGAVSRVKAVYVTGVGIHVVGGLTSLQVVGTIGSDQVTINRTGKGQVKVHADFLDEGKRTLPLAGLDIIQVVVLACDDHVSVAGRVDLPAVLDGGDGADHLNGSNDGSIIIGGGGADHLNGGNARDILIGGSGADRLVANGGDDILIGGLTLYDSGADDDKLANDLALLRLLEEWSSGRCYAERVAHLRDGSGPLLGGTGFRLRKGATVFDDLVCDDLTGSSGVDWFFSDLRKDKWTGRKARK